MDNRPVVVIGAGVAGCVVCHELAAAGVPVILAEKESSVGGLARSFHYGNFTFDIGPHRFFTHDGRVNEFIKKISGEDSFTIPRDSGVHFHGKYYQWPIKPSALFGFPAGIAFKSFIDLLTSPARSCIGGGCSFEEYVKKNYGPTLYNVFFKDYTEKFLGLPAGRTHGEWARDGMKSAVIDERIICRDLLSIIKSFFAFKPVLTNFLYPAGGIGTFCSELAGRARSYGAGVILNAPVSGMVARAGAVRSMVVAGQEIEPSAVVWTGRLDDLEYLLCGGSSGLDYLSLVLYNIELRAPANKPYQWCYFGNRGIVFSRVSRPAAFSPYSVPQGSDSLSVEVTCRQNDGVWNDPEALISGVIGDLVKTGYITDKKDVMAVHVERVSCAYPVYDLDFHRKREAALKKAGRAANLILAGRTGRFWYNNMDDSIRDGLDVSARLSRQTRYAPV